ncbi:unnamed protein product [Paramecium primaurelia]|uniref:Uncharacterized protein n=1 Tax=Paramecium primaurelia TaxID=5886 RepID=A0A8S1LYD0_PARPR|nr:unnamed protein product [Paramecium primaurelia]
MKKIIQWEIIMYIYILLLEFYSIENGKFIILLIFLALISRYLFTKKVIQKLGELIINLRIEQQNQQQQQIPKNDEYYKKNSIIKQLKKIGIVLKSKFKKTNESSIDISKKYSQFDMEESI